MTLHPAVQAIWDRVQATGFKGYAGTPVSEARAHFSAASKAFGAGPALEEVRDLTIPVADGTIGARLYRPAEARGLCVYFHGGGWVLGTLDDFDTFCRTVAQRSGSAVLSVDYRLAPEHPFPTPVDDAITSVRWAQSLPEAAHGIAVAGDSAGGNLAAVAALALRGEIDLRLQALLNPCTDTDPTRPTYAEFGADYLLKSTDVDWFLNHYLAGQDPADPRVAVLRTPDLSEAAPAWIAVAEYDVLREEGEAYADALRAAGVNVTLRRFDGVMHGFARGHGVVDTADRAVSEISEALREAF